MTRPCRVAGQIGESAHPRQRVSAKDRLPGRLSMEVPASPCRLLLPDNRNDRLAQLGDDLFDLTGQCQERMLRAISILLSGRIRRLVSTLQWCYEGCDRDTQLLPRKPLVIPPELRPLPFARPLRRTVQRPPV